MADSSGSTRDDRLGRLALTRRLVSRAQLQAALAAAQAAEVSGQTAPPLAQLLVREGVAATELAALLRELSADARAPRRLAGYEIVRELGRGGMGVVYEALDPQLGRRVALKVLSGDPAGGRARARFEREAQLAAKLTHPNIVPVYRAGVVEPPDGGPPVAFIAMAHAEGASLDERMAALSRDERLRLFEALTDALAYAHAAGVIHRDVKPANVLLTRDGQPLLADFGLARGAGDLTLTATGAVIGSAHYMAPEQVRGMRVGAAADVWALGVVLYQLLLDRRPFEGQSAAAVYDAILGGPPPRPRAIDAGIPPALEAICLTALQATPARRYASAVELAADLRRWRDGEQVTARAPSPSTWIRAAARRRPGRTIAALALVVGLLATAVALGVRGHRSRTHSRLLADAQAACEGADWAGALAALTRAERYGTSPDQARLRAEVLAGRDAARARAVARQRSERAAAQRVERMRRVEREIAEVRQLFYRAEARIAPRLRALEAQLESLAALAARPEHAGQAALHALIGQGWLVVGGARRAEAALQRAIALDPEDDWVRYALGRLALRRAMAALILGRSAVQTSRNPDRAESAAAAAIRWMAPVGTRAWDGARPLDRHVVETMLALARGRHEAVRRRCAEGRERFGDQPGSEDYGPLLACIGTTPADVVAALEPALLRKPHDPWLIFLRGCGHMQAGDKAAAERDMRRALELDPRLSGAHTNLGAILSARDDHDGALACYDRAVALGGLIARINRGTIRHLRGDLTGALADFDAAIAAGTDSAEPYVHRAQIRSMKRAGFEAALSDLAQAIARAPRDGQAHALRGWIRHQSGQLREARSDYDRSLELDPEQPLTRLRRGFVRFQTRDLAGAIEDYDRLIAAHPDHANAHLQRGHAREALGQRDAALADFSRALELDPRYADAYLARGNLYMTLGQRDRALADLGRAIELDPSDTTARMNRAKVYQQLGRLRDALADYRIVIAQAPGLARAHAHAGYMQYRLGHLDAAIAAYQRAIRIDERGFEGWFYLGLARLDRNQRADARRALEKALERAPPQFRATVQQMLDRARRDG